MCVHCVCAFITAVPIIKLFAWGEGDSGRHVLRETTSCGQCGLFCPSRTSEHGGEGDCVKEGGGEDSRESDFALQGLLECSALETERVRLVALQWHSIGSEVRLGLPVGL